MAAPDAEGIVLAALGRGEVVAAATDTVFGLLCDPANPEAVARVYALKDRPAGLELTLLAADRDDLEGLVRWTPLAERLARDHWPGALSIVLPVGERRLAIPRSGATLSVRVPGDEGLRRLLGASGPLASTSANRHGEPPAVDAAAVRRVFGAQVGAVRDGRPAGVASTIIDCSVTPPRLLRAGPIDTGGLGLAPA